MSEQAAESLKQEMEREIAEAAASKSQYLSDLAQTASSRRGGCRGRSGRSDHPEPRQSSRYVEVSVCVRFNGQRSPYRRPIRLESYRSDHLHG